MSCRNVRSIQQAWIAWRGQESLVLTLGHGIENSLETLKDKGDLIVVIPGNPGLGTMYQDFMETLSQNVKKKNTSVWTFSYIGHETQNTPLLPTAPTYNLEDQIQHKIALIDQLVPRNTPITLIGHSIGCKISMEIFKRNSTHNIKELFFLFPTIENMVTTLRGQQVLPWVSTFRMVALAMMVFISILPEILINLILKLRYSRASQTFLSSTKNFINANHLNNCMVLANNELETVLDLDVDTIKAMIGKLHIYYGADDGWSPLQYRDNLLQAVPAFPADDAVVDDHDIPHAFVEFHSEITANIVADWINTLDKEN